MSLNKLMPKVTREYELPSGSPVALIQETAFSCGGFTIGIYVSHMVCDGTSLFLFLKDWAAATCGSATQHPFLDGESIFPQYDAFPREASPMSMLVPFSKKGKHIVKRIVFKESAIDNLKAEASLNNSNNPTRVEVVTTFLSKFLMRAFKNETGIDKPVAVTHPLNIRRKVEPPLPECSVGNFIKLVGTVFSTKEGELSELVNQLREAMKKWDKDFLEKIKNREDGFFKYCDAMKEMGDLLTSPVFANGVEFVTFSSWCNFGTYDIDFGWGKPIWATCMVPFAEDSDMGRFSTVILMDTREDKGVEAWVFLNKAAFNFMEKDTELLQYVSIDPSPVYS
ncbi:hypothetical protein JCGZ_08098 [Jatropha curcas]|uniref:Uncharacterized protein n=2 Tax=Jatropha curcas TaxID=180498 RepID=A0A067KL21_JATCU|nr:hypothetical protein JCGZ_08098 [Jatropha curcas]